MGLIVGHPSPYVKGFRPQIFEMPYCNPYLVGRVSPCGSFAIEGTATKSGPAEFLGSAMNPN